MPSGILRKLFRSAAKAIEQNQDVYLSYHQRPVHASRIATLSDTVSTAGIVIVIQGPLGASAEFTRDTLRLYRRHFPGVPLIVSTWITEPASAIQSLRDEGAIVVLNDLPPNPGISNINLQLRSSVAGIRKAQEHGARYVLKTRTDQRFYAPNALPYLRDLCALFPIQKTGAQKERLIGCSLNTFKYRPYSVSDMFMFGRVEDMLLFWDAPFDDRHPGTQPAGSSIREFCVWCACEIYLVTQFIRRIGLPVDWTLRDGFRAYAEHFCIVDRETLDLYWPKYEQEREFRGLFYDAIYTHQELTFRDWFLMYRGILRSSPEQEKILDLPFKSPIPANLFLPGAKSEASHI